MEFFHYVVLIISSIILIAVLIYLSINLYKSKKNGIFPPTQNTCPDGWRFSNTGLCQKPQIGNIGNITDANINSINMLTNTNGIYGINPESVDWVSKTGKTAVCAKKSWADKYGIMWDGVSNYNSCA